MDVLLHLSISTVNMAYCITESIKNSWKNIRRRAIDKEMNLTAYFGFKNGIMIMIFIFVDHPVMDKNLLKNTLKKMILGLTNITVDQK